MQRKISALRVHWYIIMAQCRPRKAVSMIYTERQTDGAIKKSRYLEILFEK